MDSFVNIILNLFIIGIGLTILKFYLDRIMQTIIKIQTEVEIIKVNVNSFNTQICKIKELEEKHQQILSRLTRVEVLLEEITKNKT
jgi:hypothetical protein